METFDLGQKLMVAGLAIGFGGFFALAFRKFLAGRELIIRRDPRLYPPDFDRLTKADRKRLYRIHSWAAAWDIHGKALAAIAALGVLIFILSVFMTAGRGN